MSNPWTLENRVAIVTGGSRGIGRAIADAMLARGAMVVMTGLDRSRLATAREALAQGGRRIEAVEADVRDAGQVDAMVTHTVSVFGGLDILVNNAGVGGFANVADPTHDVWHRMIETNLSGLLSVTRMVLPGMVARHRGHIVNIGSVAGTEVYPSGNVYCATKYAVHALNRGLRLDTLGTGVRVTNVAPGMVETEFSLVRFHGDAERASKVYAGVVPLTADDVADAIVWAVTRPAHVNVEEILLMPTAQASTMHVHRTT